MDSSVRTDRGTEPALGESRSVVLDLLRSAGSPLGVQEVAARTGLHVNTVRFHLEGLARAGLARRQAEERDRPGRPRVVYEAVPDETGAGTRSYRLLAEMLAGLVAHAVPDPAEAARDAGRVWGRYLTEAPPPFHRTEADDAARRLAKVMSDVGFVADVAPPTAPGPHVRLRHCPFKEIAEHRREVVCPMHLGLMQGALEQMRAPFGAERLEPLVEPSLCLAHLSRVPAAGLPEDVPGSAEPGRVAGA